MLFTVVIGIEGRQQTAALNYLGMRTQIIGEIPPDHNAIPLRYRWRRENCYDDLGGAGGLHGRAVVTLDPR